MFSRPQRVHAVIPVVAGYVLIGGALIATSAIVSIMIKAGHFSGYDVVSGYDVDIKTYLTNKILTLSAFELLKYFATSEDSSGQLYVEMTNEGYTWNKTDWAVFDASAKEFHNFERSLNSTTDNTVTPTPTVMNPFMLDGYYMQPHKYVDGEVWDTFIVKAHDILSYCMVSSSSPTTVVKGTFTPVSDCYVRYGIYDNGNWMNVSYDGITYKGFSPSTLYVTSTSVVSVGYDTVSNTVYIPGSTVVKDTGIETGVATGSTVAYPISGQYSNETGSTVYTGIDGGVATVVSGLTAKDLSKTATGEASTTGELTESAVRDAVRDGVKDATSTTFDVPASDTPTLDFSPLYYDVSKKFPFCVPFDFVRLFISFKANSQVPTFHVEFDKNIFVGGGSFEFSFERFDTLVKVVRYFILLSFVYYLIRKTRAFIGNGGGA